MNLEERFHLAVGDYDDEQHKPAGAVYWNWVCGNKADAEAAFLRMPLNDRYKLASLSSVAGPEFTRFITTIHAGR